MVRKVHIGLMRFAAPHPIVDSFGVIERFLAAEALRNCPVIAEELEFVLVHVRLLAQQKHFQVVLILIGKALDVIGYNPADFTTSSSNCVIENTLNRRAPGWDCDGLRPGYRNRHCFGLRFGRKNPLVSQPSLQVLFSSERKVFRSARRPHFPAAHATR